MAAAAGRGLLALAGHSLGPGAVRRFAMAPKVTKAAREAARKAAMAAREAAKAPEITSQEYKALTEKAGNPAIYGSYSEELGKVVQAEAGKHIENLMDIHGRLAKADSNKRVANAKARIADGNPERLNQLLIGRNRVLRDQGPLPSRYIQLKSGLIVPTGVYGTPGQPAIFELNPRNLIGLVHQNNELAEHFRSLFLQQSLQRHNGILIPSGRQVDHAISVSHYRRAYALFLNSIGLTAETQPSETLLRVTDALRQYASIGDGLVVMDAPLNLALGHLREGHRIGRIHRIGLEELESQRFGSVRELFKRAYDPPYNQEVYRPNLVTRRYDKIPNADEAATYLQGVVDQGLNNLPEVLGAYPGIQDNLEAQGYVQIFHQHLNQVVREGPGQIGGAFNVSSLDDSTQKELIKEILRLINNYLGNPNFTYTSFFNITYINETPTEKQRLEDAKFTIFLLKLVEKLEGKKLEAAVPDLEFLYNKFHIYKSEPYTTGIKILNKAVANYRAKVPSIARRVIPNSEPRETTYSHEFKGGTRKRKQFKKTRKISKPRKRKTRHGLKH